MLTKAFDKLMCYTFCYTYICKRHIVFPNVLQIHKTSETVKSDPTLENVDSQAPTAETSLETSMESPTVKMEEDDDDDDMSNRTNDSYENPTVDIMGMHVAGNAFKLNNFF